MMFVSPRLKLSLVTTHIPLKDVLRELTPEKVHNTVLKTHKALQVYFGMEQPRIGVCGLNPHAGEEGLLGSEEREWLIPTLDSLRKEGISITGPLSPDTAFVHPERFDALISLYHDQGLAPFKALTFYQSCQMTLGLPFVRTSVDHGTAKDIVGKNCADYRTL